MPAEKYWGAQTERSRNNFKIGTDTCAMPAEIIKALARIKKAAAIVNARLLPNRMSAEKRNFICAAADEILAGRLDGNFPLVVWQTGSGTQTNMNVNEVIANRGNELAGKKLLHPNDDVNMSQSSNDVFPSAMHMAAVDALESHLIPALRQLINTFLRLEEDHRGIMKCGRTHLQDAAPLEFSAEISGWRSSLEKDIELLERTLTPLKVLALGATAVGTGMNAPEGFDRAIAEEIGGFSPAENKYHALTSRDELVFAHGAVKATAADLMKIANDVRWLACGPRLGLGEITIPANEPGSSIMPGKVNPTQCEQLTMVTAQVMGNDATIGFAASQGNFELNVFMPVIIYNFLQSVNLLAESVNSFNENCAVGIKAIRKKMRFNYDNSLMRITELTPLIGYETAAEVALLAVREELTLRQALIKSGITDESILSKL